VTFELFKNIVP